MATIEEQNLLATILSSVGRESAQLPNEKITGFLSMTGHAYNHELMVIGRAVNGWLNGVYPNKLSNQIVTHAQDAFDRATKPSPHANAIRRPILPITNPCPMLWVTDLWGAHRAGKDYNTAKSAFWRVIKNVVHQLNIKNINDDNWPSHLVWSNLYKISPAEGGNPSDKLCDLQLDGCLEFLKMEIKNYQPKRILFLIGIKQWEPARKFITALHRKIGATNPAFTQVQAYGNATNDCGHQYRFVVASHPMRKPEDPWVNEVLQAFQP